VWNRRQQANTCVEQWQQRWNLGQRTGSENSGREAGRRSADFQGCVRASGRQGVHRPGELPLGDWWTRRPSGPATQCTPCRQATTHSTPTSGLVRGTTRQSGICCSHWLLHWPQMLLAVGVLHVMQIVAVCGLNYKVPLNFQNL